MLARANTPELAKHIFSGASGKTGDEDASVTLADGEAWVAVGMSWARAHRDMTAPGAAQRTDDVDKFLRGPFGCKRHDPTSCLPARAPSPFPRSIFADRLPRRRVR